MSEEIVWVNCYQLDSAVTTKLRGNCVFDGFDSPEAKMMLEALEIHQRTGGEAPDDWFPTEAYGIYTDSNVKKVPYDLFSMDGFMTFSQKGKEAVEHLDFGGGKFLPLRVFENDRTTPVPGEFYILNYKGHKEALLADQSQHLERIYPPKDIWGLQDWLLEDGDIVVSSNALDGPDVWVDTPRLQSANFFSDQFVSAVRDAKIKTKFKFWSCRVT
ncbi:hypothetical protein MXMO3_00943 [Maritalea myrionectae]|uniref:Immunity MXAN-0049 protein domain-containing protein n=1 Tax=Maritalea myrionectae TaxID=454601 RepID=A0A2R4MC10_9HYPH|nr:DUF1629 domain-containing protein [Maritalea myrionectae]AVX03474.1 hypothetical protein MXMO3_00943 [Maritalea myrionectae]